MSSQESEATGKRWGSANRLNAIWDKDFVLFVLFVAKCAVCVFMRAY
jgi:hypothetical protein